MPYYGSDLRDGIAGNPFGEELFEYVFDMDFTSVSCQFPGIAIECDDALKEEIAEAFITSISDALHIEIEFNYGTAKAVTISGREAIKRHYQTSFFDKGVYITVTHNECSLEEDDYDADPVIDPIVAAIQQIEKQYRDRVIIRACILYHMTIGYNYGTTILWTYGDTEPLAATQLLNYMKEGTIWLYSDSGPDFYDLLLDKVLEFTKWTGPEAISVFWDHVPENNTELRARLIKLINDWQREHPNYSGLILSL